MSSKRLGPRGCLALLTIGGELNALSYSALVEELERLARLESGSPVLEAGISDFAAALHDTAQQLAVHTAQRSVGFALSGVSPGTTCVALDDSDGVQLAWRLLATLGGAAAPGETLAIAISRADLPAAALQVVIDLPRSLREKTEQQVLETGVGAVPQAVSAGVFGIGFALRLARAEARASLHRGGRLHRNRRP